MSAIMEMFQKRSSLPLTNSSEDQNTLRRRLSSLSLNTNPASSPASSSWSFPRSKSVSAMGEQAGSSLRKWWDWGWAWIKEDRGSWRNVLIKVRSEIRRFIGSDNVGLPQTYRHDSAKRSLG